MARGGHWAASAGGLVVWACLLVALSADELPQQEEDIDIHPETLEPLPEKATLPVENADLPSETPETLALPPDSLEAPLETPESPAEAVDVQLGNDVDVQLGNDIDNPSALQPEAADLPPEENDVPPETRAMPSEADELLVEDPMEELPVEDTTPQLETLEPSELLPPEEKSRGMSTKSSAKSCSEVGGIRRTTAGTTVCCAEMCRACGGEGCGQRPGGSASCCAAKIAESAPLCSVGQADAPCVLRISAKAKKRRVAVEGREASGVRESIGELVSGIHHTDKDDQQQQQRPPRLKGAGASEDAGELSSLLPTSTDVQRGLKRAQQHMHSAQALTSAFHSKHASRLQLNQRVAAVRKTRLDEDRAWSPSNTQAGDDDPALTRY